MVATTLAAIRQNVFNNMFTRLNANKPTNYFLKAVHVETEESYPLLVINPAKIKPVKETFDSTSTQTKIMVMLEFYDKRTTGPINIDIGRDTIFNFYETNGTTIKDEDKMIYNNWEDLDMEVIGVGDEAILQAIVLMEFDLV